MKKRKKIEVPFFVFLSLIPATCFLFSLHPFFPKACLRSYSIFTIPPPSLSHSFPISFSYTKLCTQLYRLSKLSLHEALSLSLSISTYMKNISKTDRERKRRAARYFVLFLGAGQRTITKERR